MILHQHFAINGSAPGRRFFEIGRRLAEEGHQVTVITTNSELELSMGKKRIGLLQQEGVAIVAFNLDYGPHLKEWLRRQASSVFASRAYRQGRNLPPPDLVLTSSPPLAQAGTAFSLSSFYRVPLILEIREIEDQLVDNSDSALRRILYSQIRRRALKAYCHADSIFVPSRAMEMMASARTISNDKKIIILPDELDYKELFHKFKKILAGLKNGQGVKGF